MAQPIDDTTRAMIDAALPHVAFDGWSDVTFKAAVRDSGTDETLADVLFPKGCVDLALAYHRLGDQQMADSLLRQDLSAFRFRDRIAEAVRIRLEAATDREVVRRGTTLFALPQNAPMGAKAIWDTADTIWTTLGDTSTDVNWYTKRATLSGVYSATVLYWLGDDSVDHADTWAFLDRRIEDVMRIEKAKAHVRDNPILRAAFAGPTWLLSKVRAPMQVPDVPSHWTSQND